jgi:hypothetical protein
MPQLVAAAIAKSAVAAPVAASTAAATTAATAAGTAAAQTAALEAAKQAAIQQGMQQVGVQAGKTAALEASKKGIIDASMQQVAQQAGQQGLAQAGTQAAQQSAVEAAKQGIFSANPAGMPPTAGGPITPPSVPAQPLPPAGSAPNTMSANLSDKGIMTDAGLQSPGVEILPPKPGMSLEEAQALSNQIATRPPGQSFAPFKSNVPGVEGPVPEFISPQTALPGRGPVAQPPFAAKPYTDPGTLARAASDQGISKLTTSPVDELMGMKPTEFPLAPKNALQQGFETALEYVKDNPITSGMGLMSVGQYMNRPKGEEEDKDKYKSTVDMSEFRPSVPEQPSFTRSYEYQKYAVGGPVETMAAQNAVGANTGYPMAGINTPMYSNPMVQRPEAVNVISPSGDAGVSAYSGEPRFASGGISSAERREYGLKTRGERAARSLTTAYEEMEAERQKEAMRLFGERSDPGIIPRSRTQQMSSPFSAAMAEHARLGKKAKVPVVEMPKTNLGDIDNYMDIPIEAASGGIMHGLGGYSDGGRLLKGPGDGVSDSIPAVIGKRQPARLADGEFVIPARIVSELGNGSTEAGARKLYAMMERVQASRKKSIGKKKVAVNSKADKHLPA